MFNSIRKTLLDSSALTRKTFHAYLAFMILQAPFMVMLQYASFVVVHNYQSDHWVPFLTAIIPFSNLLAFIFSERVNRSADKIAWFVWPHVVSFTMITMLFFVHPPHAWLFSGLIILAVLLRTPFVSASTSLTRAYYPPEKRSQLVSMTTCALMVMGVIFSLIVRQLLKNDGMPIGPFYAAAGLLGLAGVWRFNRLRRQIADEPKPQGSYLSSLRMGLREQLALLRDTGFRNYQISFMLFGSGNIGMMTLLPLHLKTNFGAVHDQALLALVIVPWAAQAVVLPFWGRVLDRHNPLVIRLIVNTIWLAAPVIFFFAPSVHWIYVGALIVGCMQAGGMLIWLLGVNYYAMSHNVAIYMGMHQTLTGFRGLFMPFIAKLIADFFDIRVAILVMLAFQALGTLVVLHEIRRERRLGILTNYSDREVKSG